MYYDKPNGFRHFISLDVINQTNLVFKADEPKTKNF